MVRLEHEPAFVLHSRQYGETSLIVDLFTRGQGRLSVYARGARKRKKNAAVLNLTPFTPLIVSAQGKGSLKSLTNADAVSPTIRLEGKVLFCGLYLNELLVRILPEYESQPDLFNFYLQLLARFSADESKDFSVVEPLLRQFEWRLIQLAGISFDLTRDAESDVAVQLDGWYRYQAGRGMVATESQQSAFSGASLLALAAGRLESPSQRAEVKRLMRGLLKPLLGSKPLTSRTLFG